MPAIESPGNPLVREIARGLEERTLLLLEGEKTILDAVSAGLTLEHVLHDASIRPGRLAALTSLHPRLVSRAVLERLADARTPQHLLAVARRRDVPVAEILGRPGPVVFVFGIQDPGNLGAIVRVCEAAGGAGVLGAPGSADFFHPRAVRASAGSVLRIPVSGKVSFEPFAADAKANGRPICGAVSRDGENALAAPLDPRSVLVVGAEGGGLPAGAYRYLDRRLTIPMAAPVDSLNAAVATALLLYSPSLRSPSEA
ncbi:MAG TPA: RNA methyltransferase [Thermoanaerobaculia bacterium]|nr:RNA methyltransferase [Thermoanaerobaculia bacterium]